MKRKTAQMKKSIKVVVYIVSYRASMPQFASNKKLHVSLTLASVCITFVILGSIPYKKLVIIIHQFQTLLV